MVEFLERDTSGCKFGLCCLSLQVIYPLWDSVYTFAKLKVKYVSCWGRKLLPTKLSFSKVIRDENYWPRSIFTHITYWIYFSMVSPVMSFCFVFVREKLVPTSDLFLIWSTKVIYEGHKGPCGFLKKTCLWTI